LLLGLAAKDEDIVHVDDHNSFVYEFSEDVIHHHLECFQTVSETKEHELGFEQASVHLKVGFPLISLLDPYIVVSPSDIQLGEVIHLGFGHFVEDIRDQGQEVSVLHGHHIELLIILDNAEASIFLLDEEDGGCHW